MTAKKSEHAEAKWVFKNAISTAYIIGLITYLGFIIPLGLIKVFNGVCGEYSVYDSSHHRASFSLLILNSNLLFTQSLPTFSFLLPGY